MRTTRLGVGLVLLGLSGTTQAAPSDDASARTAAAVLQADHAFADDAARNGAAAAFRDAMDPSEGLVFTGAGKPTTGAAAIYKAIGAGAPDGFLLSWAPTHAWGSRGGDMGVTTGEWAESKRGSTTPIVTGSYVTVWHLDAAGRWKGLVDIGEPDPKPVANAATRR